jgi:hypothetical protein
MRHFLPLFLTALAAPAQVVSFGIVAGVPLTPALSGHDNFNASIDTGRWTVGPSIDFHLFRGFSFDAGMLFRGYSTKTGFLYESNGTAIVYSTHTSARDFDFPLLLKYRFLSGPRRPFVEGGVVWTYETHDEYGTVVSSCLLPGATGCQPPTNTTTTTTFPPSPLTLFGVVAGVGGEFKYRKIRIAPEFRYTNYLDHYGVGSIQRRELTILLGFSF